MCECTYTRVIVCVCHYVCLHAHTYVLIALNIIMHACGRKTQNFIVAKLIVCQHINTFGMSKYVA